jgi:hypothetical protein
MTVEIKEHDMSRFSLKCYGRKLDGSTALSVPVSLTVKVSPSGPYGLSLNVDCRYNTGSHGQRCKASHPDVEKSGDGVVCPYAADLPYALDKKMVIGKCTV